MAPAGRGRRSSLKANACTDFACQIRRPVFPATTQPRGPIPVFLPPLSFAVTGQVLPTPPIAGRPARAPPTRAGLPRPGMQPHDRIGRSQRVRAGAPSAPGRPSSRPVRPRRCVRSTRAGLPPQCPRRQQLAQLRETDWAIPMPASWRPMPDHLVPARGRGGSRLVGVDLANGTYPAWPGVGRRSLFPRHVAPHRYTRTGARYS